MISDICVLVASVMGKSYENYMSKKDFHPTNLDNLKRKWMAEQRHDESKRKEEEMRKQYEKEQEIYNNKVLMGNEKAKLGLNFMYEPPPGAKKDETEMEKEQEFKFEWQKVAPRESYVKNSDWVNDQPFGICVRNVKCMKCKQWGHINTDRECPMYQKSLEMTPEAVKGLDTSQLQTLMAEEGYRLKQSASEKAPDRNFVIADKKSEQEEMKRMLTQLSNKQKLKLLKKLGLSDGSSSEKKEKKSKKSKKSESSSSKSERKKSHKREEKLKRKEKRQRSRSRSEGKIRDRKKQRHDSSSSE